MDFHSAYAQGFARVAACTVPVTVADPAANAAAVVEQVRACHEEAVALAVFPELCLTGYAVDDLVDQSFAILYPSFEEFVAIRNVGVEPLKRENRYSDERIMARRDGSLFWCRVRGHSLTRDDDPLGRAVWSFADLSQVRQVLALSTRERQIVMHLGEGRTSKEIARMLDVSPRTVEAYRARLLKKCGAVNVAELLSHLSSMPH